MTSNKISVHPLISTLVFFTAMGLMILFSVLVYAFYFEKTGDAATRKLFFEPLFITLQIVFSTILFSGLVYIALKAAKIPVKASLGFFSVPSVIIIFSMTGVLGLGFLTDEIIFILHESAPLIFSTKDLANLNSAFLSSDLSKFILLTAVIVAGPAIGEEILFRGLIFRSFKEKMPGCLAVLLSAVLFAVMHMNALQGMGAFLMGLYLGYLFLITGSIWPAIIAHGLNNFICAVSARFFSPETHDIWETGHELYVIIMAFLVFGVSSIMIYRFSKN